MYLCTWCMQSTLGSVTGKGRLNEIFIMCICLLLRQTTYSITKGRQKAWKSGVWGARGNVVGIIYPLVDIGLFKLIWKNCPSPLFGSYGPVATTYLVSLSPCEEIESDYCCRHMHSSVVFQSRENVGYTTYIPRRNLLAWPDYYLFFAFLLFSFFGLDCPGVIQ